ncbi:type I-C CRISPR-associated protein Cas8c/Csd1 (plasmid) [Brevibacillus laterosporus]|uniref:type I-C CRISPR-associated protein Cas8c/Csd1 n=1 Tax=Brevibacillus laterosporus TaxID=1465 RepID=UPI000E6BB1D3|nr:type I-C CRISPR-associated protein Cas8c/Csd1 [Brevibacillus laterosporus]AYB41777.1 type I-C CRISPR-associated protein Cas8c/Csd1 [Brevibacillus laterosporus]
MILQSLYQRYIDMSKMSMIDKYYYSTERISFVLEISLDGRLLNILDVRDMERNHLIPIKMSVPQHVGRSSNVKPYFLCDTLEYLLGYIPPKSTNSKEKFESCKLLHFEILSGTFDEEAQAVIQFYQQWDINQITENPIVQSMTKILNESGIAVVKVEGSNHYLHDKPIIYEKWIEYQQKLIKETSKVGQCLVTGEYSEEIARIHDLPIKGIKNAHSTGASLVCFNQDSFKSYGKDQGFNAPTSYKAVFGYTTALNQLLDSENNCIHHIGDMTTVFWSRTNHIEKEQEHACFFRSFIVENKQERSDQDKSLKYLFERIRKGAEITEEMKTALKIPFFVMGLSPNKKRVFIRFFWQGSIEKLLDKCSQHANDLEIDEYINTEKSLPTITNILLETVSKDKKINKDFWKSVSSLEGQLLSSILEGSLYPFSLFAAIVNRINVDRNVNSTKAAIIKAYLLRYARIYNKPLLQEVTTVALNEQTRDIPYRLGRLFAVLEKAQAEAVGGKEKLNRTVKDRYFSSAVRTPGIVFPSLIITADYHMSESTFGFLRERNIQEILEEVDKFPTHLNLQQQGVFILGYYHQKQHMYKKGEKANDNSKNVPTD